MRPTTRTPSYLSCVKASVWVGGWVCVCVFVCVGGNVYTYIRARTHTHMHTHERTHTCIFACAHYELNLLAQRDAERV